MPPLMRSCLLKNVHCSRGGDIKTKAFKKMSAKTKEIQKTVLNHIKYYTGLDLSVCKLRRRRLSLDAKLSKSLER
jgi:hypothetical protein